MGSFVEVFSLLAAFSLFAVWLVLVSRRRIANALKAVAGLPRQGLAVFAAFAIVATIHAQKPPVATQTVTFDANGGTPATQVMTYAVGAKYSTYPQVELAGHDFVGWFTAAEGGVQVTKNTTVTASATRTFYAHWIASEPEPEPDPPDPPSPPVPEAAGTVVVPKSWKTGQTVTWKAVAAQGGVFAHWKGEFVDSLALSRNELRNPSLKFAVPENFDTNKISAVFVAIGDDRLGSLSLSYDTPLDLGAEVSGLEVLDDSESYVKASVGGLPGGLKFDAKTMRITGSPRKSGAFVVSISAKNASGYQWAENVALLVKDASGAVPRKPAVPEPKRTAYYPITVTPSSADAGTVSGTGVYADGKKVSISAKPAKGLVFAGWYCDEALTTPMEFASGDYRKASQSVVVSEATCLYARFVKATAAADPISGLAAKGSGLVAENSFGWRVGVAVPEGGGIEYASASLPSASAAKLPSGVKFDAAKGRFTGVPTKAGTYSATVTVKNASKSTATLKLTIEVSTLDAWAQGSFDGEVGNGESASAEATADKQGTVSLTVGATGKISGKILEGGKTWTLSAASFSRVESGSAYFATVIGKNGKELVTNEVTVVRSDDAPVVGGMGVASSDGWTAWQNLWKRADAKASMPVFKKSVDLALDSGVNLTFKKDGAVAFAGVVGGTKVSGSSQLVWNPARPESAPYQVTLYAPPKGAFAGYFETVAVALTIGDGNVVTGVDVSR